MRFLLRPVICFGLAFLGLPGGLTSPGLAADSVVVNQYEDWTVYKSKTDNGDLCFVASTPKDFEPKKVNRGDIFFYVTTWPKFNVTQEVSVKLGYPLDPSTAPVVSIGAKNFVMFEKGNRAYIKAKSEGNLLRAMKSGRKMIVRAISKRGTKTKDVYSLSGVTAALKTAKKSCQ